MGFNVVILSAMKFGKRLRLHLQETLPDWRDKYLCYKVLKILVKQISTTAGYDYQWQVDADAAAAVGNVHGDLYARYHPERNRRLIVFHQSFVRILNEELEKFNYFFLEKEEEFIIRLQVLVTFFVYRNKLKIFLSSLVSD